VDVRGLKSEKKIRQIGRIFGLHLLMLGDIVHTPQAPKLEKFENFLFFLGRAGPSPDYCEQISVVLGNNWVITFQETHTPDALVKVRERLALETSRVRKGGADYLAYALIDLIVDSHFPILDQMGEHLLALEERIFAGSEKSVLEEIQNLRRGGIEFSQILRAQRKAVLQLSVDPSTLLAEKNRPFFRDVADHASEQVEVLTQHAELVRSARDAHMSVLNQRLNEVMRFLTLISTIFIPLSFFSSVYGMNFAPESSPYNMPELTWRYGYLAWWLVVVLTVFGMVIWFRRKRWIE
ncbi:MAG: magnesium/cobalt transporter CorA, partial [Planctomycetota bacterium]|nr:magnesium/cobalt transporter CorA [Planctomycetota bacterium]